MKILILGAGAIGGFFGAHLMKSGANVSFLVREKRKDKLKKSGINIFSINGELKVNPKLLDKNLSGQHFVKSLQSHPIGLVNLQSLYSNF